MAELIPLARIEGRLCGHIAAALAIFVAGGKRGFAVPNEDMGDWYKAARALEQIGVATRASRSAAVLVVDAEDMPNLLSGMIGAGDPRIAELISAFIAIACCYGDQDELLSDDRDWFEPPARYLSAMKWLARTGYAECRGGAFRWTEQIAPAMRESYCWNEDHQSCSALALKEQQAEAERAWQTMPDTLRRALVSGRLGFFDLVKALCKCWKDGTWQEWDGDKFHLSGQTTLASNIMALAKADQRRR